MIISHCRTNHMDNPLGIWIDKPVFSYIVSDVSGKKQRRARIVVSQEPTMENLMYDSNWREDISSTGFQVDIPLKPRTRYYWQVECETDTLEKGISDIHWFETGKMDEPSSANWIKAPFSAYVHPVFRIPFNVDREILNARLYICGLGVYEASLNGQKVGNEFLSPGFTSYDKNIYRYTYDITNLLQQGDNVFAIILGNGWYRGRFGFHDQLDCNYGDDMQVHAEIIISHESGIETIISTKPGCTCFPSPILDSNIYDGEIYDARSEVEHWCTPGPVTTKTFPAVPATEPEGRINDRLSLPVTIRQEIPSPKIIYTPANELVMDFGQIVTGWVAFTNVLPANSSVHFDYGELLQNGNFYNENLRSALAQYTYYSSGKRELVRPHFTFYGFRYVRVHGVTEEQLLDMQVHACVLCTKLEDTGFITTSNAKINRLIQNAKWSQIGNFLDVPTDCPQRDERMGWTGDAQVFCATASFLSYTPAFYKKYLYDMLMEQGKNKGSVPHVVPDVLAARKRKHNDDIGMTLNGSCAWGDAATIIPWTLYQFYGDKYLLEDNYENMKQWVDYIQHEDFTYCANTHIWSHGFHFADWLSLDNPDPTSCLGGTDSAYVATAFYYWSSLLVSKAATVLNKQVDANYYKNLADKVLDAFQKKYIVNGHISIQTQTALAMALHMDLVPMHYRTYVIEDLLALLRKRNMHLDTGFVGTSQLCAALSENNCANEAYTLLLNEDYPSWLYEVNLGATTIWERWNSLNPDGTVSDTGMNSMNHYTYGAIVEWMFRVMAGLNNCETKPGFKRAYIKPVIDHRFSFVQASYLSASGLYKSSWHKNGQHLVHKFSIPFDTEAFFIIDDKYELVSINNIPANKIPKTESGILLPPGEYECVATLIKA